MNSDNGQWDDMRRNYDRSEFDADGGICGGDIDADGLDLDFNYSDTDTHPNEIAELYSYTENIEFQHNLKAFENYLQESLNYPSQSQWQKFSLDIQKRIVLSLLNQLDSQQQQLRINASRCILYIAQGCFAEVMSDEEQIELAKKNVMNLYEWGTFTAFVELLNLEIENSFTTANIAKRKVAISIADSADLRIILSILYIITEVIRSEQQQLLTTPIPSNNGETSSAPPPITSSPYKNIVENFIEEINQPFGDELLTVKLLGLITRFCNGTAPHIPIKKVLLLLWKISLVGLGGMETLRELKKQYRMENDLCPINEDTLEIARCMRASSPPPLAADILTDNPNTKRNRPFRRGVRTNDIYRQESLMKQTSLDEQGLEIDAQQNEAEDDLSDYYRPYEDQGIEGQKYEQQYNNPLLSQIHIGNRLPWTPKVRQKDIVQFLEISRNKFIGYTLPTDHTSLAGLPQPIHESFRILNRHIYVSLADKQIQKEKEIARNPISNTNENDLKMTSSEILYQAILPNLPQYMIALLKILLAAAPTSKVKNESINIIADVLPEIMPITISQSTKLGIDVNRHKEIIVKSISAILLLYLKHFKINHIYQFEFMSQHLVFANCIPLILKFFNQNISNYIGSQNNIPIMDFPSCILNETTLEQINPNNIENNDEDGIGGGGGSSGGGGNQDDSLVIGFHSKTYSWRNLFSCINLLRILNKLTKWKHSRIMMLVVFKSAPILKRTLKIRYAMMQLYVLKLLKMQTKYLGRQWRKTNMKTISAIYTKVRHHLNDDWAYGNDLDARPWDFQAEECTLRAWVDRFNNRRYMYDGNNVGGAAFNNRQIDGVGGSTSGNNNNNGQIDFDKQQSMDNNGMGNIRSIDGGAPFMGNLNEYDQNLMMDINHYNMTEHLNSYGEWNEKIQLTDEFKENYEKWLDQDVYNMETNWDLLFPVVDF